MIDSRVLLFPAAATVLLPLSLLLLLLLSLRIRSRYITDHRVRITNDFRIAESIRSESTTRTTMLISERGREREKGIPPRRKSRCDLVIKTKRKKKKRIHRNDRSALDTRLSPFFFSLSSKRRVFLESVVGEYDANGNVDVSEPTERYIHPLINAIP